MSLKLSDYEDAFEYLDDLRLSGRTNMFGASSYLEEELEYDKKEAKALLMAWMSSFKNEVDPMERAEAFYNNLKKTA